MSVLKSSESCSFCIEMVRQCESQFSLDSDNTDILLADSFLFLPGMGTKICKGSVYSLAPAWHGPTPLQLERLHVFAQQDLISMII